MAVIKKNQLIQTENGLFGVVTGFTEGGVLVSHNNGTDQEYDPETLFLNFEIADGGESLKPITGGFVIMTEEDQLG